MPNLQNFCEFSLNFDEDTSMFCRITCVQYTNLFVEDQMVQNLWRIKYQNYAFLASGNFQKF